MRGAHTESIFRDAREAIVFALNYRGEQYAKSRLALLAQEGGIGTGRGLYGLDGAATAGIVKAKVEKLSLPSQAVLLARCTPCGSAEWSAAIAELERHIWESLTLHAELVTLYVRRHFGERMTMQDIADRIGVTRVTAHRQATPAKTLIETLEAAAWAQFEDLLRTAALL